MPECDTRIARPVDYISQYNFVNEPCIENGKERCNVRLGHKVSECRCA